jgi:hypothetical protein
MIRTYRVSGFCFFFVFIWFLFERFLLLIPMELAPPVSDVVLYYIFWTVYYFVLLLLFYYILDCILSSCVCDKINHT